MLALHHTPMAKKSKRLRLIETLPRVCASKPRQFFLQLIEQLIGDFKISGAQLMLVNWRMTVMVSVRCEWDWEPATPQN